MLSLRVMVRTSAVSEGGRHAGLKDTYYGAPTVCGAQGIQE